MHVYVCVCVCLCGFVLDVQCVHVNVKQSILSATMSLLIYIGVFYYMLGNIEPRLRSSLQCIQLLACITIPMLEKYGLHAVLKPFIDDVNKLSNVSVKVIVVLLSCIIHPQSFLVDGVS